MISDSSPVSAGNLKSALGGGVAFSDGIGGRPVSAENLRAALERATNKVLFEGSAQSASLSGSVSDYEYVILVMARTKVSGTPEVTGVGACPPSTITGSRVIGLTNLGNGTTFEAVLSAQSSDTVVEIQSIAGGSYGRVLGVYGIKL